MSQQTARVALPPAASESQIVTSSWEGLAILDNTAAETPLLSSLSEIIILIQPFRIRRAILNLDLIL